MDEKNDPPKAKPEDEVNEVGDLNILDFLCFLTLLDVLWYNSQVLNLIWWLDLV